jgi:hypothetical protein
MTPDVNSSAHSPTAVAAPVLPVLWGLAGSLAFVAVGVGMALAANGNPLLYAAAVLVIGFFGFCGVLACARLWSRAPALIITDQGLEHRVFGTVSWARVSHVAVDSGTARRVARPGIDIVLRDPSAFVAAASGLARMTAAGNVRRGLSPLFIPETASAIPLEQILAEMVKHNPSLRSAAR